MQANNNDTKKDNGGKMILKSIYFEPNTWQQARRKAGLTPLSAIVRKLVKLWLQGKINLDNYED